MVLDLPRPAQFGPGTEIWHQIPAWNQALPGHSRFFSDIHTADGVAAAA
jgi:hypothetical protein